MFGFLSFPTEYGCWRCAHRSLLKMVRFLACRLCYSNPVAVVARITTPTGMPHGNAREGLNGNCNQVERLSLSFLVRRVTRQRLGLLLHRRRRKIQQGLGALYKQFDFLIRWSASVRVLTVGRYRFVFYVAWPSFKVDCSSVFFMWFRKVPNGRREPA